jgi:outer membrane lipoprotein-sorting protein
MKNPMIWFLAMLFLSGLLGAQTLEEILAMNYQARGGLDKLKAVTAVKMTGTVIIPAQGLEMALTMWQKNPAKIRIENTFQDKVIVKAYDGLKAWTVVPFMAPDAKELSPEQSAQLAEQAGLENPLLGYRDKGYRLELLGREDLDGIPAVKLKLTKAAGREIYFYLDAASGLELKSTTVQKSGAAETCNEIVFADYKPVSGLLMPFVIENRADGKTQVRLILTAIEINPAVDDAIFVMPAKKAGAVAPGRK